MAAASKWMDMVSPEGWVAACGRRDGSRINRTRHRPSLPLAASARDQWCRGCVARREPVWFRCRADDPSSGNASGAWRPACAQSAGVRVRCDTCASQWPAGGSGRCRQRRHEHRRCQQAGQQRAVVTVVRGMSGIAAVVVVACGRQGQGLQPFQRADLHRHRIGFGQPLVQAAGSRHQCQQQRGQYGKAGEQAGQADRLPMGDGRQPLPARCSMPALP